MRESGIWRAWRRKRGKKKKRKRRENKSMVLREYERGSDKVKAEKKERGALKQGVEAEAI